MKRLMILLLLTVPTLALAQPSTSIKLVLVITADQFRYDYLTRFQSDYKDGLKLLLTKGSVFTNAQYEHFPTVTAIGHSVILTGAMPSISGIVGNDWYDRESGRNVTSVSDDSVQPLGGRYGASPRRMLVSTLGDELKSAGSGASKVIGISLKDRSAILPAGHQADGAYWFDEAAGDFVSSTYYFKDLPGWVKEFNANRPANRYRSAEWLGKKLPPEGPKLYAGIVASPFGNELLEDFAEQVIAAEQLGQHREPDLLSLSYSSNDYVGHSYGPDSPEVREVCLQTDRSLGKLFRLVDSRIGMQNVIVVFTADHGVAPVPEVNTKRKMPGGRMPNKIVQETVQKALEKSYGNGKWIVSPSDHSLYLNRELIQSKKLSEKEVHETAAQAVLTIPHVLRVYTREQLTNGGALTDDGIERRVRNGFNETRGADIYVLLEPYWIFMAGDGGTTHGTGFDYDVHVPLIFLGQGIKTGRFHRRVAINDLAPTLAILLNVAMPGGSTGQILSEIFAAN